MQPFTQLTLYKQQQNRYNYIQVMKKDIHPTNYRLVVFKDLNNDQLFLMKSSIATDDTIEYEGQTYPLATVHITRTSHPFFTGEERVLDIEGRVDKFKARAQAAEAAREKRIKAAKKQVARKAARAEKPEAKSPTKAKQAAR